MKRQSVRDTVLQLMRDDIAAYLPDRVVGRSLRDSAAIALRDLQCGVLCVVTNGGGNFANWQGREAELGDLRGTVVGYVSVGEREDPIETERAELALLEDLLGWFGQPHPESLGSAYAIDYRQSAQMEHPVGWIALQFELRNL